MTERWHHPPLLEAGGIVDGSSLHVAEGSAPSASGRAAIAREERRVVSLSGWLIHSDGSTSPFHLNDLSYAGCKIATEVPLATGEQVRLAVKDRGLVQAEVRWRRNGSVGLRFCDLDPADAARWPRRTKRFPVRGTVRVKRRGRARYALDILDLSINGCKVAFAEQPAVDESVVVKLDGMEPLEARVCWVNRRFAGLRFSKTLHPAVLGLHLASYVGQESGSNI